MKNRSSALRKFGVYILPMLLWMLFIFGMSTDRGSAKSTNPTLNSILARLIPGIDKHLTAEQIDRIDWNIRKVCHVTEYAILSILIYRAVAQGNPKFRSRNVVIPILLGVAYAASDEYHQSFVVSRGASAADVFFDSYGVLVGQILCLWHFALKASGSKGSKTKTG